MAQPARQSRLVAGLVGNTLYEVTGVGEVAAVNADTGEVKWKKKLGPEQRQSSPFAADGKVYVAFYIAAGIQAAGEGDGGNGELYVFKPGEKDAEVLSRTRLTGRCYGSPIAYNGKLYVQTDKKLYSFGKKGDNTGAKAVVWKEEAWPEVSKTAAPRSSRSSPTKCSCAPARAPQVRVRSLDANGFTISENVDLKTVKIETYIPPTALVKATMNGKFYADGKLTADATPIRAPAPSRPATFAMKK